MDASGTVDSHTARTQRCGIGEALFAKHDACYRIHAHESLITVTLASNEFATIECETKSIALCARCKRALHSAVGVNNDHACARTLQVVEAMDVDKVLRRIVGKV
jgi:hypothetical protein